jgi:phosphatidylserine decarboxylase precursor-related protein
MKISKEGYKIIFGGLAVTVAVILAAFLIVRLSGAAMWPFWLVASVFTLLFAGLVSFFREPSRPRVTDSGLVFSAADGKVVVIEEVFEGEYLKERCIQVSVFMSIANVHVNWYPVGGKVLYREHHPGSHMVAWHPKSSEKNERMTTVVDTGSEKILFRQIAGLMARRIVNYAVQGAEVAQNTKCGMIKLGSRVDIFLPLGTEIIAKMGDKVRGSQTPLARLKR